MFKTENIQLLLFLTFLLLLSSCNGGNSNINSNNDNRLNPFDKQKLIQNKEQMELIIEELHSLFQNDNGREHIIKQTFFIAYDKFKLQDFSILINNKLEEDIFKCTKLEYYPDQKVILNISPFLINLYKKRPSLVFSILIYDFWHISAYFTQTEYVLDTQNNPVEQYRSNMEAMYIQTLFIKDYMLVNEFKISEYENNLLLSLEDNNLAAASIYLYKLDMDLVYYLDDYWLSVKNNSRISEAFLEEIRRLGSDLKNEVISDEDDNQKYYLLISMKTYYDFIPVFLSYIHTYNSFSQEIIKPDIPKEYPVINNYLLKIQAFLLEYNDFITEFYDDTTDDFQKQANNIN